MYKHILVPTDGSKLSLKAAKHAAGLARGLKAKVTAVYVIEPYMPPMAAESAMLVSQSLNQDAYRKAAEKRADDALGKVRKALSASKVRCDTLAVTDASPWHGIIATARKHKCDVIVMASHGRGGLAGVLLGSDTSKVLTHSKTPVLVCR